MISKKILNSAFTLIELLVVIAIIGILSGLIIVGMNSSVSSARIAKAQIFSASLRDSMLASIVSDWKFDGLGIADGGNATTAYTKDTWGESNCSITGTPLVYSGSNCIYGSCLKFNGTSDSLDCGNNTNLNMTTEMTVEAWFNPKGDFADYAGHPIAKWGAGGTTDANIVFYYFGLTSGMNRTISYYANRGGTWGQISPNYTVLLNNWYQIVLTYNSTDGGQLYINGVAIGSLTGSGALASNNYSLSFGSGFNGVIDQVRIYKSTIPSSRIRENYYSGINKLLADSDITKNQYQERIIGL